MSEHLVLFCTCPDQDTARRLARLLVSNKLAACVNIIPGLLSVFSWEGNLVEEDELLLVIKTRRQAYAEVEELIKQEHPYDVPELIALPIELGLPDYLAWLG